MHRRVLVGTEILEAMTPWGGRQMTPHRFRLVFLANHKGHAANEAAGFPLDEAAALVASGTYRIDDSEPEKATLEGAIRVYKRAKPSRQRWEIALAQPRYCR